MSGAGPLADLLGARPAEMTEGRCRWELTIRPEHMNPYGVVHGGVIYALVDYAMGGAIASRLRAGERCATVEVKINYLAAVADGNIRAEAWVVERTNRIGVLEAKVYAGTERLIAIATGTFYIHGGG